MRPSIPALLGLLPLLLSACVYDRTGRSGSSILVRDVQAGGIAIERIESQVEAERTRIDTIEERASLARRNVAKSAATSETLVDSVQALAGELQNLRHSLEKSQAFDADLDYRLADLAFRLMAVEENLGIEPETYAPVEDAAEGGAPDAAEETGETAPGDTSSGDDAPAAEQAVPGSGDAVADAVAIPVDATIPGEEVADGDDSDTDPALNLLARALRSMQTENYAQAGRALTEFLESSPDSERVADARVLLGDCLLELGRFNEAISQYEDFIQLAPDHPRVPGAMLNQGLAFIELGTDKDLSAARVFLDDLIERFPDSPEAAKAQRKLQILE